MQNAALIDQKKIREQLAAYESSLADSNASTRASNDAQLLGYGEGSRMRERLQEMWSIRHEFEQKNNELLRQYQAGEIEEALWKQEKELNKNIWKSVSAISRIIMQRPMLYVITGMQDSGGADQLGRQCHRLCFAGGRCCRFHYGRTGIKYFRCTGRKCCGLEKLGSSILQEVSKILMNAAIVNGLKSLSGAGGWLGTVGGWISGRWQTQRWCLHIGKSECLQ